MYRLVWIILFGFFMTSCLDTQVSLSGDDYKLIDSLYNQEKEAMLPELDKECLRYQDSVLQIWIDSIMTERQAEIEKLINR